MTMITRPLLAGTIKNLSDLKYPIAVTPKLDGIRVLKVDGEVLTRNFKPLPNRYVRELLTSLLPDGVDGEIMLRNGNFNETQSAIMSFEGEPDFQYNIFDYIKQSIDEPYVQRMKDLSDWVLTTSHDCLQAVLPKILNTEQELLEYEQQCLAQHYEGVMIRSLEGRYKCGRSTVREGILLKLKRFSDAEAIVTGFEEKLTNLNEKTKDEFGLSKRSSEKDGMVPAGTLGSILVQDIKLGVDFSIGSGFDDNLRAEIWNNRSKYLNCVVKYKYQEIGSQGRPRFPVFLGFRSLNDMS